MTITIAPVQKTVLVRASVERAFRVFTEGFDTWWPRSHHIGSSPMTRAVIEGEVGGRCYSEQQDGTTCPRASEVEVTFTPEADGRTRVDLEHRRFDRHGAGAEAMRSGVDSPNGWGGLLDLFKAKVEHGS